MVWLKLILLQYCCHKIRPVLLYENNIVYSVGAVRFRPSTYYVLVVVLLRKIMYISCLGAWNWLKMLQTTCSLSI